MNACSLLWGRNPSKMGDKGEQSQRGPGLLSRAPSWQLPSAESPGLIILSEPFATFNSEGKDLFPFFSLNLCGLLFRRKKGRERGDLHLAMRETVRLVLEISCVI